MRGITLANRAEAPGLDMPAVGEKHRILHDQYRALAAGYARGCCLPVGLQDLGRTCLGVVEQPIRRLRARPRPARLVDRRAGRLGQMFRGFHQATIQAFVGEVGTSHLLSHPLGRLRTGRHHRLYVRVFATPRLTLIEIRTAGKRRPRLLVGTPPARSLVSIAARRNATTLGGKLSVSRTGPGPWDSA